MKILIAEDDDPKLHRIREVLENAFPHASISSVSAANAALTSLRSETPDLLILDMSLPTFEVGRGEPGGRPQDFGGLEVMDHLGAEDILCPVIIVTQHNEFPLAKGESMSREEVAQRAAEDHAESFIGLVYYRSVADDWEAELRELATTVVAQNK